MDQVGTFRARLETTIEGLADRSPQSRERVYHKVREFVALSRFAPFASALEQAIEEVERAYSEKESQPAPPQASAAVALVPIAVPRGRRGALMATGAALLVFAGGLGAYWVRSEPASDPEFSEGVAHYSDNPRTTSAISSWSTYYTERREGDKAFVEAAGPVPLYSLETFEIDPAKTYEVSARARTIKDDPSVGGSRIYIGVATYDERGKLEEAGPGPHRFPAAANVVLASAQGWTEFRGTITGTGNETHNQFRPGTRSARLVALLNNASPEAVAQIDYLRFREVPAP